MERLRLRLDSWATRHARYVVAIDGGLVVVVGIYALIGALNTFQGDGFLLVVAGFALILFGLMMIVGSRSSPWCAAPKQPELEVRRQVDRAVVG